MVQHVDVARSASVQLASVQHFDLPELHGISREQVDVHLKLYEGYVTALNGLRKIEADLSADPVKNALALDGAHRRCAFEFNGARMHELYFSQWEHKAHALEPDSALGTALRHQYGSIAAWEDEFRTVAKARGVGWTVLHYDRVQDLFLNVWVDEHHIGLHGGVPIVLVMDMWEHAYMVDYVPAEKTEYVDAFFRNLNWSVMEARFARLAPAA
jgi:Fe-Mn family superoxide dismutase